MQIELKIRRMGGSDITLFGKVYKFRPDELGRHVCEVEDKKAIQRFLQIPEGYRIVGDDDEELPPVKKPPANNSNNQGLNPQKDSLDEDINLTEDELEAGEGEEDETDPEEDGQGEGEDAEEEPESEDDEELSDPEAVKAEWEATFNKKSGRRTTATMLKDLREAEEG